MSDHATSSSSIARAREVLVDQRAHRVAGDSYQPRTVSLSCVLAYAIRCSAWRPTRCGLDGSAGS